MAAAKEFNIGKDTLVDFLASKGFSRDDLKPTSKLTEEMYHSLQQEFSSDKAAKAKSDAIEIPKGSIGETKRKKDEEEILFKKDTRKKAEVAPPPPPPTPVPEPVQDEIVPEPEPIPVVEPEPVVELPVETIEVPEEPVVAPAPEVVSPESNILKIEAPELNGPKILDKIDLAAIESSTRPKRSVAPIKPVVQQPAPKPVVAEKPPVPAPVKPVAPPPAEVSEPPKAHEAARTGRQR
jgi:translation initiation factor IF-2